MLQSSWTDPVLGVDIHIVLVPTPAGPVPTPLPSPFTGMVLDPAGAAINAAMGGSMILVGGMPATACGTAVVNLPPHLPVPGPFQKGKLDDDAKLLFGALNVTLGGGLAVRLGDIAMSCNDPVRMPTSTVLAIPKGSLVLVMPAMVPDLALMVQELAFAAFRWWQKSSKLWKAISEKLKFADENPGRLKQLWNDAVCFLTGHPVDVATGRVITSQVDLALPGALALRFERRYDSVASNRPGTLAPGWSHNYAEALWPERGRFAYRAADGREIEFSTLHLPDRVLAPGSSVYLARERLRLRCVRQYQYVIEDAGGTVREFFAAPTDPRGRARLVRIRNRLGEEMRFAYDAEGRLDGVTDAAGRTLRFEHDGAGRVVRVDVFGTDGRSEPVAAFSYDAAGDLVEATDALGQAYRYAYVEHLLVKETNKNGLSFYFQYDGVDSAAKCIRTWGDGGIYDHAITYTPDRKKTLVENSLGFVTLYEMDETGQVVSVTDALGRKTAYEYDDAGRKTTEVDGAGAETKRQYDERGNLSKLTRPDGAEIRIEHNAANQPVRAVDPLGGEWQWGYDGAGRLVGRANPLGEKTQFDWDGARLVAITDPAGQETKLGYDAASNLSTLVTPDGARTEWTYDAFGRVKTTRDVNGNVQRRYRDPLGRVERVDEADGNVRTLEYDAEGNVVHAVDKHHDVRFEYRGMNRLAARTEAGTRVAFHYDTEDQLASIQNEHGLVYRFVLDGAGDVSEEYGFDDLRRRYVRDPAGRVKLTVRPEGKTTEYAYDPAGRVLAVTHGDGSKEAYAYRKDGALVAAENHAVNVAFERDALGRIVKELQGEDWVASEFTALGLRRQITSSKGLFERVRRNAMGDVIGIDAEVRERKSESGGTQGGVARPSGDAAFNAAFTRDRLGLELERSLPGGIRSQWQRDAVGRPVRQEIWRGESTVGAKQYVWDAGDRLTKIIDAMTGPIEYAHDALGNLEAAKYADGRVDLRMPDAVGNLFKTGDKSDREYGRAGQLLASADARGITRYEYDAEGNLAKKLEPSGAVWTYHWSASGTLAKVVRPDGKDVTFAYDALGRRVSKTYRGKTTRWIWDGNVPLHEWIERGPNAEDDETPPAQTFEYDGEKALKALLAGRPANGPPENAIDPERQAAAAAGGTVDAPITWLFEPESFAPLAKLVNGERYGIVTDHLGTPTRMFDSAGEEVWAAEIDTYGDLRNLRVTRAACPFRWPEQYEDSETGLYYNRFRYYDKEAGGYVSQDPTGLHGGLALHGYVRDPLIWVDPFGLEGCGRTLEAKEEINRGMVPKEGEFVSSPLDGAPNATQKGVRTTSSVKPGSRAKPDISVASASDMVGPSHTGGEGLSGSLVPLDPNRPGMTNARVRAGDLPEGLKAIQDHGDHVAIVPATDMTQGEFQKLLNQVPWS